MVHACLTFEIENQAETTAGCCRDVGRSLAEFPPRMILENDVSPNPESCFHQAS